MKNLKIALTALVIAGGTFGAFAFTKANTEKANDKKADLYWFTPGGSYIDHGNASVTGCPDTGTVLCAQGYNDIDEDGQPIGEVQQTVRKPQ